MAGRIEEAEPEFRAAAELAPEASETWSDLAFVLNYLPGKSPAEIFAAHREFSFRRQAGISPLPHAKGGDPERRLRIGYVSGDFHNHAVAVYTEPLLARHDHDRFEIFCYSNNAKDDAVTGRFKGLADHWRDIRRLDDEAASRAIA